MKNIIKTGLVMLTVLSFAACSGNKKGTAADSSVKVDSTVKTTIDSTKMTDTTKKDSTKKDSTKM
jgi:hypothetical protein